MARKDYHDDIQHKPSLNPAFILINMKKKDRPQTNTKNPEPKEIKNWIIWAAWADRITFEDIKEKTGFVEGEVIKLMRRSLKPSSFKLWRKRVTSKSIKHRKKFEQIRRKLKEKINKNDF